MTALRKAIAKLGWTGLLGLLLGVSALTVDHHFNAPLRAEISSLRERVARLEGASATRLDDASRNTPSAEPRALFSAQTRLAAFYLYFDRGQPVTDYFALLHAHARSYDVTIGSTDYRRVEPRGASLAAYSLTLPLTGRYSDLRGFIDTVLAEIPVAALDKVSMRRRAADGLVEASLELTFFLRTEGR